MPVLVSDIKFFLSGGTNNADPNASLGGAISDTEISSTALDNLFDRVSANESTTGATEYRCLYIVNTSATDTLFSPKVYLVSNTPSPATEVKISLDEAGPFSAPDDYDTGLGFGDLGPNAYQALWVERTVNAGAGGYTNDGFTLTVTGETR